MITSRLKIAFIVLGLAFEILGRPAAAADAPSSASNPGAAQANEFESYQSQFEKSLADFQSNATTARAQRLQHYTAALENIRATIQQAGDLEKLKAVLSEIDRVKLEQTPPPLTGRLPEIDQLAKSLTQELDQIGVIEARGILDIRKQYHDRLKTLEVKLTQAGKLDDATAVYDERKKLDIRAANDYYNRSQARKASGDLAGALADLDTAIELNPDDADAYKLRDLVKKEKGRLESAPADSNKIGESKRERRLDRLASAKNPDGGAVKANDYLNNRDQYKDQRITVSGRVTQTMKGMQQLDTYILDGVLRCQFRQGLHCTDGSSRETGRFVYITGTPTGKQHVTASPDLIDCDCPLIY